MVHCRLGWPRQLELAAYLSVLMALPVPVLGPMARMHRIVPGRKQGSSRVGRASSVPSPPSGTTPDERQALVDEANAFMASGGTALEEARRKLLERVGAGGELRVGQQQSGFSTGPVERAVVRHHVISTLAFHMYCAVRVLIVWSDFVAVWVWHAPVVGAGCGWGLDRLLRGARRRGIGSLPRRSRRRCRRAHGKKLKMSRSRRRGSRSGREEGAKLAILLEKWLRTTERPEPKVKLRRSWEPPRARWKGQTTTTTTTTTTTLWWRRWRRSWQDRGGRRCASSCSTRWV
jgi:hypothetical protein